MEQVLPDGKVKVTGVAVNEAWRQKHEEAKRKREERWKNNPQLREKYEARKKAREEAQQQKEAQEKAALEERVRKKMMAEAYMQMGLSENYIEEQRAIIDKIKESNPYLNGEKSLLDELKEKENIAMGAVNAANADKRSIKQEKWSILRTILELINLLPEPIGNIIKIISLPFSVKNIKRKEKSQESNLADSAPKVGEWEESLKKVETQIKAVVTKMQSDEPMMVEKYKTMKKEDFNLYLKGYVAGILKEMGLATAKSNEILNEMSNHIKNKSDEQEEKKEGEEKEESVEEEKEEGEEETQDKESPEKETEDPENKPEEKEEGEEKEESVEEEKEEAEQTTEEPAKEEPEQEAEEPAKEEPEQEAEEPAKEEPEQPEAVQPTETEKQEEIQVEAVPVEKVPEGAEVQTAKVVEEQPQAKTDEAFLDAMKEQQVGVSNKKGQAKTDEMVIEGIMETNAEVAVSEWERNNPEKVAELKELGVYDKYRSHMILEEKLKQQNANKRPDMNQTENTQEGAEVGETVGESEQVKPDKIVPESLKNHVGIVEKKAPAKTDEMVIEGIMKTNAEVAVSEWERNNPEKVAKLKELGVYDKYRSHMILEEKLKQQNANKKPDMNQSENTQEGAEVGETVGESEQVKPDKIVPESLKNHVGIVEKKAQAKTDEAFLDAMKQQPQENNEVEGPSVNTVSPQEIEKAKREMEQEKAENTKETEASAIEITVKVPKAAGNQKIVINKGDKGVEIEQMGE